MILDRELRYLAANPAYLEVTGSSWEQLRGRQVFERFPNDPDDPNNEPRRMLETSLKKVLRTGERDVLAFIPYRVGGDPQAEAEPELRIWSATHVPLFDADGAVEAVLQHTEDVTTLKGEPLRMANVLSRAEQVQRDYVELRAFIQTINQAPGFMAFLRGPEHVFEYCNNAYERLVGDRRLVGKTVREALPELIDQGILNRLDHVFKTREPYIGRNVLVALQPPGAPPQQLYLDFVYQPILDVEQEVQGILVQGEEVTEIVRARNRDRFRALASEMLAAAGEDIEAALEQVANVAVETLADWAIVDLFEPGGNRRLAVAHADPAQASVAAALRDYPLELPLISGHPLRGLEDGPVLNPSLGHQELAQGSRTPSHLEQIRAVDPTSAVAVPLGHGSQLYGTVLLLTAGRRFRYDEDDLSVLVELGRVIGTALDNARLSQERRALLKAAEDARARAEAANRSKDDFLALLGHELRNPLAPILGAVDVMRRDPTAPLERVLQVVERQARHLTRLVDDLLDVSRIEHGKLQLRQASVSVEACVTKAVEMAIAAIESKNHELSVSPLPSGAHVFGDEARIAQVLANLLVNAARYTPEGGRISMRTRLEDEHVAFEIRDSGIGIDREMLKRIYEPFVQAPQDTDRAEGGLGLGLSLVQQLVRMHGGTVQASSEGAGKGSAFTVRLPKHEPEDAELASDPPPKPNATGLRITVVDDNADATELLTLLLGAAGHYVEQCHDGPSGLAHLSAAPPDVGIIDLGLPGLDGLELATRLRATLGDRTPPLIALTGYGSASDRARTAEAGFNVHLTKPVDIDELLEIVSGLAR